MGLNPCRNLNLYLAIKELHEEKGYPIYRLCKLAKISRDAYYDWLKREPSPEEQYNEGLAALVWEIHETFPEMGYRRINDFLKRECHVYVNGTMAALSRQRIRNMLPRMFLHGSSRQKHRTKSG